MNTTPLHLMTDTEHSQYILDQAIELAMTNPLDYIKSSMGHVSINMKNSGNYVNPNKVTLGVIRNSEEAAMYYLENTPFNRKKTELALACAKWRSCADLMFPQLRRYMDDELRNEIIAQHSDYAIFAIEALKFKLEKLEERGLLMALASNTESVHHAMNFVRKYGSGNIWDYNLVIARCAYTSETLAWELVKEFPKTLVFSSAARWHSLAVKMINSNKVDRQVKDNCIRYHSDIALKFVNSKDDRITHTVFFNHPKYRERILRRKDLDQSQFLKHSLRQFLNFQKKICIETGVTWSEAS